MAFNFKEKSSFVPSQTVDGNILAVGGTFASFKFESTGVGEFDVLVSGSRDIAMTQIELVETLPWSLDCIEVVIEKSSRFDINFAGIRNSNDEMSPLTLAGSRLNENGDYVFSFWISHTTNITDVGFVPVASSAVLKDLDGLTLIFFAQLK